MPKKSTKHLKSSKLIKKPLSSSTPTSSATGKTTKISTRASPSTLSSPRKSDSTLSSSVIKQHNLQINPQNVKRWTCIKKQMGFSSDDDFANHLLDLAESSVREKDKSNFVETQDEINNEENDNLEGENDNIDPLSISDSNKQNETIVNSNKLNKKVDKIDEDKLLLNDDDPDLIKINYIEKYNNKSTKIKHHKNKTKHHKDKRKKRKHLKTNNNIETENDIIDNDVISDGGDVGGELASADESTNNINDNIVVEQLGNNTRGIIRDESVIQKTDKLDNNQLVSNLNDKNKNNVNINISDEHQDHSDPLKEEVATTTTATTLQCSVVKHVSNNAVFEVINNEIVDTSKCHNSNSNISNNNNNNTNNNNNNNGNNHSTESINEGKNESKSKDDVDEKKSKRKRKHLKHDAVDSIIEQNNDMTLDGNVEESINKHRKKRHKHTNDYKNKKNHDVRKAPLDGVVPNDIQVDTNSETVVTDNLNDSQNESDNLEPQRLAIKIKLCQDCNHRHIQGVCPLTSTLNDIFDAISYDEWVKKYENNAEVVKALAQDDPMSEGYGKIVDDGFESDEEAMNNEQYKSKSKGLSEEKCLQIDGERPLYSRDSLPKCLGLKLTSITDHGIGVFAKNSIAIYSKLGPLVGKPVKEMDIPDDFSMRHIWEIDNDGKVHYISTTNPLNSNWIRYMRPAETKEERNVSVMLKNGELYFVTIQNIQPGGELIYWAESQTSNWVKKNKTDKTNCGGCNLNFAHTIYYRLHCCIFHDTNYSLTIRKYHCKVCGAAVLGKDNIMKHAAELHGGRGAYQCQYCRKFFLRLNYLEMHRTYGCAQNPQRSRPLCDFCGRKFCQPQKLKVHIKRMHSDMSEVLREFQCKSCLKLLGSRAALQRHMKEVHHKDVVGAATCDRCGKMFQNKSNLKIHMLTHSGVKPFKCKENSCKAAFTTKQCLQFHYKKVHGLTEEMMPKIERSVAYTFDAYSGGPIEEGSEDGNLRITRSHSQEKSNNSFELLENGNSDENEQQDVSTNSFNSTPQMEIQDDIPDEMPSINHLNQDSSQDSSSLHQDVMNHVNPTIESTMSNVIRQDHDFCAPSRIQSKGSKKWMGEFNPPSSINPSGEHSQALSINTADYEFEDSIIKKDEPIRSPLPPPPLSSLIDDNNKLGLSVYRRTESTNASLLVEAALDAAERDIGAVSSPILEDNDRDGNLYSISNQLQSPLQSRSPESHLESYMQQQDDLMSPVPTPDNRNPSPVHIHNDYHMHRSIDYITSNRATHNIEQYLHHDELPRNSSPNNYIHLSQGDLNSLSASRYPDIPPPHHHHHHHHHQVPTENLSSDEGDSVAQNLSLSVKEKNIQLELPPSYKYESLDMEFGNRERNSFEPIILNNNGELQGLDMSARGFHAFGSQVQSNRYSHHHHLYDITDRQSVDLSRTGAYSISPPPPPYPHNDVLRVVSLDLTPGGRHSVDLTLSRSHLHGANPPRMITSPRPPSSTTPHIVPDIIESRIVASSSPPPPPPPSSSLQTYNPNYPLSPTPYHPPRPTYHHYSGYY